MKWREVIPLILGILVPSSIIVAKAKKRPPTPPPPQKVELLNLTTELSKIAEAVGDTRLKTISDAVSSAVEKLEPTETEIFSNGLIGLKEFVTNIKQLLETEREEEAIKYIQENISRVVDETSSILQFFEMPEGEILRTMLKSEVVKHVKGDRAAAWVTLGLRLPSPEYKTIGAYQIYDDKTGKQIYVTSNLVSGIKIEPVSSSRYKNTVNTLSAQVNLSLNGFFKSFSPSFVSYPGEYLALKQVETNIACAFVSPCSAAVRGLEFPLPDEYTEDSKVFGNLKFNIAVKPTGKVVRVPADWAEPVTTLWEWTGETKTETIRVQTTATQVETCIRTWVKLRRFHLEITVPEQTLLLDATTGDIRIDETWYEIYSAKGELKLNVEKITDMEIWALHEQKYGERIAPEASKSFHITIRKYDDQYRLVGEYAWAGATITLRFVDGRIFTATTDSNGYATLQGDVPVDVTIDYLEVKGIFEGRTLSFRPDGWSGNKFLSSGTIKLVFNIYPAIGLYQLIVGTDFSELGAKVVVEPDTISQITYGLRYYNPGAQVKLTSMPPSGYKFVKWVVTTWRPDGSSTTAETIGNPTTITMDYHKAAHATLEKMTEQEKTTTTLSYESIGQVPAGTPGAFKLVIEGGNVWPVPGTYWFKPGSTIPIRFGAMQYATLDGARIATGGNTTVNVVMNSDHYVETYGHDLWPELPRTYIIGYVYYEDRGPAEGCEVIVTESKPWWVGGGSGKTDSRGYFAVGGPLGAQVIEGRAYYVIVYPPGYDMRYYPPKDVGSEYLPTEVYVTAPAQVNLILRKKPPPATVEGFVVDKNNRPFPGLVVKMSYANDTSTDANGYFKLTGLKGTQSLLQVYSGYKVVWSGYVTPPETVFIKLTGYSAP